MLSVVMTCILPMHEVTLKENDDEMKRQIQAFQVKHDYNMIIQ